MGLSADDDPPLMALDPMDWGADADAHLPTWDSGLSSIRQEGLPQTYDEAVGARASDEMRSEFLPAIEAEFKGIIDRGTFKEVPAPAGVRFIGTKFVFTRKYDADGKYVKAKARLVAVGPSQRPGQDFVEKSAPVARASTLRVLVGKAAENGWPLDHMDADQAYLQGVLDETLYVRPPPGWGPLTDGYVLQLMKPLYGLRQAGICWYRKWTKAMLKVGFVRSKADNCLYIYRRANFICLVATHVDDSTWTASDTGRMGLIKKQLSKIIDMKDLGRAQWLLGMKLSRDWRAGTITLTQSAYILDLLERFNMSNCKPKLAPATEWLPVDAPDEGETYPLYRQAVGALSWLRDCTRPDIALAVGDLASYQLAPRAAHWSGVKQVLRYLKGTSDLGIVFGGRDSSPCVYTDSEYGGHPDRVPRCGFMVFAGGPIAWRGGMKQKSIARSSCEAEYVASSHAAAAARGVQNVLDDIDGVRTPFIMYQDNQGSISMAHNLCDSRTKHIEVHHHFVRDQVYAGNIKVKFCPTGEMLADILTKPLTGAKYSTFRGQLLGNV
jgi:hypothetical protein